MKNINIKDFTIKMRNLINKQIKRMILWIGIFPFIVFAVILLILMHALPDPFYYLFSSLICLYLLSFTINK